MSKDLQDQSFVIHTQYIKDQSFENPNAPAIYAAMKEKAPQIEINVDVTPARLGEETFEITLMLRADAKLGETTAFIAELQYAAVVSLSKGVEETTAQSLLLIEVPRLLFPFARAAIASITRDGGFPPLLVNTIDFKELHESRLAAAKEAQDKAEKEEATA
ncbi:MAG: protein-export chaperone SecB [Kiloniellales bacterium]|nr:protein-export chaperone SecB [Kiloniellales bacterium]